MPKKKKHPRLPNGFGQIVHLSGNRRNPYAVYPPCDTFDSSGRYLRKKALCYVPEWLIGFAVLTKYSAGTYQPGDELEIAADYYRDQETTEGGTLIRRILADYSAAAAVQRGKVPGKTFAELYREFYAWKYDREGAREYAATTRQKSTTAFKNCQALHDRTFTTLASTDLQSVIDRCHLKTASKVQIIQLFHEMYDYADKIKLCSDDASRHVKLMETRSDTEHGVPFTETEVLRFWQDRDDPVAARLLILCYSGWRIMEYAALSVDLDAGTMTGGAKTAAGKNRIVPIHSAIRDLVAETISRDGFLMENKRAEYNRFLPKMHKYLASRGIDVSHTPHDCRHTFSGLCERYHVSENDRKRMLGHSLPDVTNSVYGHRTADDLREEIEKIPAPAMLRSCCD